MSSEKKPAVNNQAKPRRRPPRNRNKNGKQGAKPDASGASDKAKESGNSAPKRNGNAASKGNGFSTPKGNGASTPKGNGSPTPKSNGTPTPRTNTNSKSKSSGRRRDRYRKKNESNQGFKLVLRHLPPKLSAAAFAELLTSCTKSQTPSELGVVDHYFVTGSLPSNIFDKPTYARAYFTFDTMENLKSFAGRLKSTQFSDDLNNVTTPVFKLSPYVKRMNPEPNTFRTARGKKLEGTIEKDSVFQQFLRSMKKMQESEGIAYVSDNVSIFRSLDKQLAKEKELQSIINKKNEQAMIQLAGGDSSDKKKKSKKSRKKKKNKEKEGASSEVDLKAAKALKEKKKKAKKEKKEKKRKAKKAKASLASGEAPARNVVILEEAGKRELRNRQLLQERKEKDARAKERRETMVAKAKEKKQLLKKKVETVDGKENTPLQKPSVKLLKRED